MKNFTFKGFTAVIFLLCGIGSNYAQLVTTNADNGSAGTLRSQIAAANSGAIILIAPGVTNIVLASGEITIDKSLTITGNGLLNTTVNGNANGRIFNITSGNVTLNDIDLTNGAAENGGAILVSNATLTVNLSRITNSVANGASGSGGAINVGTGSTLSVFNSLITGNTANRAGGGIESVAGTTVNLTNVTLSGNNAGVAPATAAPGNGGGFHITGAGTANIDGGIVSMNRAAAEGGGLWNGTGTMTIDGTQISENTASGVAADNGGGGIYNLNAGTLVIRESSITNNVANGTSGSGGGILNDMGSNVRITNTVITGNTANRAGGGIESNAGFVTMLNVSLNGNTTFNSPGNGGGLHVTGAGTSTITGGTVNMNNAGAEGGGLWNGTGTMTIDGTTISANTASGASADQGGGGIYNLNGGTLVVQNATISNNIANGTLGSGGGILNDVGSQLSVTNSSITGNSAVRAGGGIEDNSLTSTILLTNVSLNNNMVTGPPGNGGGLHITGAGNATITGGTVNNNSAALEGGGLWNGSGTMTVIGTSINGNVALGAAADDGGAGVFNTAGTVNLTNVNILNNNATGLSGSGGGIFSLAGTVNVTDSDIESNSANRAGGGIEVVNGILNITNSNLVENDVDGGAGNPNPGNGGALHISGVTTATIANSFISGNDARREGGGLWNQTGSTMVVNTSNISLNTASGPDAVHGGGGIFNNGGTLEVNNSSIYNNVSDGASGNGGGLHVKSGSATLLLTTISGNTSANNGGGIYNNASFTTNAVTIANNTAVVNGGGVAAGAGTLNPGVFKNSLIADNSALLGQDIFSSTDPYTTNGYNIIGEDDDTAIILSIGDVTGTAGNPINIFLGPLADNGGSTMTHALLPNSPAYNAGSPADLFADQIGFAVFGEIRDIGAFEAQSVLGLNEVVYNNSKRSVVYPNPSSGIVNIDFSGSFGTNVNVRLIEVASGKVVKEFTLDNTSNKVALNQLSSGIYAIHLTSDSATETHKLVID